jgi:hypothetical protein
MPFPFGAGSFFCRLREGVSLRHPAAVFVPHGVARDVNARARKAASESMATAPTI